MVVGPAYKSERLVMYARFSQLFERGAGGPRAGGSDA